MGLFTLGVSLFETLREIGKEKQANRVALEEKRRYEDIDFDNIESVILEGTEQAFRTETREEYDAMGTIGLSNMNGQPCYTTTTVHYEVPDGANYCFAIKYRNDTTIYRKFHESSPITERLLEFCVDFDEDDNDDYETEGTVEFEIEFRDGTKISSQANPELTGTVVDVAKSFCNVAVELDKLFNPKDGTDYDAAVSSFRSLRDLYHLNENSTEEDFIAATAFRMSSLAKADEQEYNQAIYELLLFILSTPEDGDILEKTYTDGFSYLQESDLGTDAFVILPKFADIDNGIVKNVNEARIRQGFRKAAIVTTGNNLSALALPDIIIWDLKLLCSAYIKAFKSIVTKA